MKELLHWVRGLFCRYPGIFSQIDRDEITPILYVSPDFIMNDRGADPDDSDDGRADRDARGEDESDS